MIYAVIINELGLAGAMALLGVYLLLVARGLKTAVLARDSFSKLLATGLSFVLALQVFVIVGGVTRVIPLTGVTLPFVAYGGSSVVMNFVLIALLLVVSDRAGARRAPADAACPGTPRPAAQVSPLASAVRSTRAASAHAKLGAARCSAAAVPRRALASRPGWRDARSPPTLFVIHYQPIVWLRDRRVAPLRGAAASRRRPTRRPRRRPGASCRRPSATG